MPETTFLHIRSRDASSTRVLEVGGASVRIGRGEQCEVKLGGAALADVQCMLRRRGVDWHVQPVGPPGRISLEGRAVEQTRPLPMGAEFRVGDHWLSLRPVESPVAESWGTVDPPSRVLDPTPAEERVVAAPTGPADRASWQDRLAERERRLEASLQGRRWEARWKAAGTSLKARSTANRARIAPASPPRTDLPTTARPTRSEPVVAAVIVPRPTVATVAPPVAVVPEVLVEPTRETPQVSGLEGAADGVLAALERTRQLAPNASRIEPATPAEATPTEPEVLSKTGVLVPIAVPPTVAEVVPEVALEVSVEAPRPARRRARRASLGVATVGEPVEELAASPFGNTPSLDFAALLKLMIESPMIPADPVAEPLPVFATTAPILTSPAIEDDELIVAFDEPTESLAWTEPAELVAAEGVETEEPGPVEVTVGGDLLDWPSARTMFAPGRRVHAAQATAVPRKARKARAVASGPTPTTGRAPGQWSIPAPGWLWGPTVVAAAVIGVAGVGLSWAWAQDDQSAGRVANRLLAPGAGPNVEEAEALLAEMGADGPWWKTTAGHLLLRAALADRAGAEAREQVPGLLRSAQGASPSHAATRLARARVQGAGGVASPLAESLGLSRDVVALAWTGHRLAEAGKVESALKAYRAALELVAATPEADQGPPRPIPLGTSQRLTLPGEELVEPIVRELAGRAGWSYGQWVSALPRVGVAPLVAARVLRELGQPEAEAALDAALATTDGSPVGLAAHAEALALKDRFEEAEADYRRAIAATGDARSRRAWSFNLSEVCSKQNDDARRQAAWEAAKGGGPGDEITRLVAEARIRAGADRPLATIARRP